MRRWILSKDSKSIGNLTLQEVPIPEPKTGEVRIKNYAVSLNYRDVVVAKGEKGMAINRDIIPCSDGAGLVDAIGEGVNKWKIGDKVVTQCFRGWYDGKIIADMDLGLGSNDADGTLAEYFLVKSDQIVAAPMTLSYIEAATIPCAGITAWSAIHGNHPYIFPLHKGEKVLILGTGGVSSLAIPIATNCGAEVYCTTSQDSKIDTLKTMGVKEVINYKAHENWGEIILEKTGGVDLVVNTVGVASMDQAVKALAMGGRMSMVGAIDDKSAAFTESLLMMRKNNIIFGVLAGNSAAYTDYIRFIDEKNIKPLIQEIFDFKNAYEAYKAAASSHLFGKIVIQIDHI